MASFRVISNSVLEYIKAVHHQMLVVVGSARRHVYITHIATTEA